MQILPFWLMSIFQALKAFYFLTSMTWEVFGMSGKFKLFQWWSQVVEFDTKHLNVVGISFAQVCLSLPHSNLPNKGSWARARGYSCAQALPLWCSTERRRCARSGARGLLFHSALARALLAFACALGNGRAPTSLAFFRRFSQDFLSYSKKYICMKFWDFVMDIRLIMYRKSLITGVKYIPQIVKINSHIHVYS